MKGKRHKWSRTRVKAREELAAERAQAQQEPTPMRRRAQELVLVREVIDPAFLAAEPSLSQTQWVQYGYMSPLERTELFCRLYLEAYRCHYAKYRDSSTAHEKCPIDLELFKNEPGEINSLWRARQVADEIGMRYAMFLGAVMGWATNTKDRKYFPRPNQLYGPKQFDRASEKWKAAQVRVTLFDDDWDDRFFQADRKPDPPRAKALRLAIVKLMRSTSPELGLSSLMGFRGALSEKEADFLFRKHPEILRDAKRRVSPPTKTRVSGTLDPYLPPCLGLPHAAAADPCRQCKFSLLCEKTRAATDKLLHAKTGSSNPLADKKRELARIRQKRKRDKDQATLVEDSLMLEAG